MNSAVWDVRAYAGEADLAGIDGVRAKVRAVEGDVWMPGPDSPSSSDEQRSRCLVVEAGGEIVAYTWMVWWREAHDVRLYLVLGWVDPAWRRQGIGSALIRRQIAQASALAEVDGAVEGAVGGGVAILGGNAGERQDDTRDLLLRNGFTLAFTVVRMAADLPARDHGMAALPDGLTVRPVAEEHFRQIHELVEVCFRDNGFGYEPMAFEEFRRAEIGHKDLELWHAAWHGEQLVALVAGEIDDAGVSDTPWVAVHPQWRRRGVARALLSRSLVQLAGRGVRTATISTVAENANDTLGLYREAGFEVVRREPRYRRPV